LPDVSTDEFGAGGARVEIAAWLVLAAAAAFAVAAGFGLSGDALIHVVFMENAAAGRWLEFNRGVADPSSTSVLWTALGALLWLAGGAPLTALGIKAIGFACLAANGWLVFGLARRLGASATLARATAAAVLAIPSTLYNSVQGMENVFFASLVLAALAVFAGQLARGRIDAARTVVVFALLGLSCATRPEGVVLGGAFGLVWLAHVVRKERDRAPALLVLALLATLLFAAPLWVLSALKTGHWLPTSGVSRMMYARRDLLTVQIGPLWLYGRALGFLAAYAPLALLAIHGLRAGSRGDAGAVRHGVLAALAAMTAAGLALYTFVTGAAHASRYLIWVFPLLGLAASQGVRDLRSGDRGPWRRAALWIAVIWLAVVAGADGFMRSRGGLFGANWGYSIAEVSSAPQRRGERTDELLSRVCAFGCCQPSTRPAVAAVEVQHRYFLDERVDVLSMDGVTVGPFRRDVEYDDDGCPALERIEDDRSIVAMLDPTWHPGVQLGRCQRNEWVRAVGRAWDDVSLPVRGWVRVSEPTMLIRDCRGG
jgi:hypothetical protein